MRSLSSVFVTLALCLLSCSERPHGKDGKGYFVWDRICVKSHIETHMQYYGKNVWMPKDFEYCDEYDTVKRYIDYKP